MEHFPFVATVQVRWRDLDANGHVNNAAIVSYLETARTELWRQRFGGGISIPFVVRRLHVDYRRPITLDDPVRVGLAVTELRGASYSFVYRVEADGRTAATGVTQMAHVDERGRPVRMSDQMRSRLATLVAGDDGRADTAAPSSSGP